MKDVFVIIAFHAHEPLWDMHPYLLSKADDIYMRNGVTGKNYVREREFFGRNIYIECLNFARRLNIPVTLEASNELLFQIHKFRPETFSILEEAYKSGVIYPVFGNAHHTHAALIDGEAMTEEITQNIQFLTDILQIPKPRYLGYFPTEDSIDVRKLEWIKRASVDYVIFPAFGDDGSRVHNQGGPSYEPFTIGNYQDLIGLPRNFPISQEIWRPITLMKEEQVFWQGYMFGTYEVFPEQYRGEDVGKHPISMDEAVAMYRNVLRTEAERCHHNGLLMYMQDLELMDFGEDALKILGEAWMGLIEEKKKDINFCFVTPDEYLTRKIYQKDYYWQHLEFDKISWAPEIRPVLRPDGHYPPRGVKEWRGHSVENIFKEHPFIFWEPGKYFTEIYRSLFRSFCLDEKINMSARALLFKEYDLASFPIESRLAMHFRLIQRACNWGWRPDEDRQKRPFLHGYFIAYHLINAYEKGGEAKLWTDSGAPDWQPFDQKNLIGLERSLDVYIGERLAFLEEGLSVLGEPEQNVKNAQREMALARNLRVHCSHVVYEIYNLNHQISVCAPEQKKILQAEILLKLKMYCRLVYLAADQIQRTWMSISDTAGMVRVMYRCNHKNWPPKFVSIINEIDNMSDLDAKRFFAGKEGDCLRKAKQRLSGRTKTEA
ncbi:MAG: hypothetical protein PHQ23_01730 [Candidatus Wallbacteria bacterium]|nr:hypothetical protein [Candidatus Wallbacteria bacterium]